MSTVAVRVPDSREVREWAIQQGLAQPTRGRLSKDAIVAFNRAHKRFGASAYQRAERVRTHSVKPTKGRTITRNYRVSEARAWAESQGLIAPGLRGRLSREVLDAYILSL